MVTLRTLLFIPGNQQKMLAKATTVTADAVIFDLEDSVPPAEKDSAREMVAGAISGFNSNRPQVYVRINSSQTPYCASDIAKVVTRGLHGICLPKSESAEQINQIDALISKAERAANLPPGSVKILALVARGILKVSEIATSSPRIMGLALGAEDFAVDMGTSRSKEGLEIYYPRMVLAVACHAADVQAIDTVYVDVKNIEGLVAETRFLKQIGFQGKLLIHPGQIAPVNEVFTPSAQEIAYAKRVIEAFDAAVKQGLASTPLDGKMVDTPVAERARRLLAQYETITGAGNENQA
jgi:citrate lyase subunit beta/citryl-CoA lyase